MSATAWHVSRAASGPRPIIFELAKKPGGVGIPEAVKATGRKEDAVRRMIYRMTQQGQLFKEPGRYYGAQWFATKEAAEAFTFDASVRDPDCPNKSGNDDLGKYRKLSAAEKRREKELLAVVSPNWKQKKYLAPKPVYEPVITGKTIVTICPSAPVYSRHQCAPGDPIPSVISARECSSWARTVWGAV
jgi:hypothetical protein